jgi:hypothetical protein
MSAQSKIDEIAISVLKFLFRYYFTEGTGNDVMFDLNWQKETREAGIIVPEIDEIDVEKYETLKIKLLPLKGNIDVIEGPHYFTEENMVDIYEDNTIFDILLSDNFWNETFGMLIRRELVTCYVIQSGIWMKYKEMNNQLNTVEIFSIETLRILGYDATIYLEYGLGKYIDAKYNERYLDKIRSWVEDEFLTIIPK